MDIQIGATLSYCDAANPETNWEVVDIDGRWLKLRDASGDENIISRDLVERNESRLGTMGWRVVTVRKPDAPEYSIRINWSENGNLNAVKGSDFPTFSAFDSLLAAFVHTYPTTGAYDKTNVTVTHCATGERYECRLDVMHPCTGEYNDTSLRNHIVTFCMNMIRQNDTYPIHPEDGQTAQDARIERLAECVKWAERALDAN